MGVLRSNVKTIACASVGLSFPWVLMRFSVFFTLLHSHTNDATATDPYINQCFALFMVFIAITCVAAILYRTQLVTGFMASKFSPLFFGACASLGFVLISTSVCRGLESELLLGSGIFLSAVFSCLLFILWGARTMDHPLQIASVCVVLSMGVTCVILALVALFPAFTWVFSIAAPILCGIALVIDSPQEKDPSTTGNLQGLRQLNWRILIPAMVLLSLCALFNKLISSTSSALIDAQSRVLTDIFTFVMLSVLLLFLLKRKKPLSLIPSFFIVSVAVMMLGLLLIMLPSMAEENIGGSILMTAFYGFTFLFLLQLIIDQQKTGVSPVVPMAIFVMGAVIVPLFLSNTIVFNYAQSLQSSGLTYAATIASILSFLVAIVVFILLGSRGKTAPPNQTEEEKRQVLCAQIAEEYGLSKREEEVLLLLYQGRSRKKISEILVVTPSTAQGHVSHIYQKIGIHKRDELIDFMDNYLS